jgi:tetratricopeptide (TPR) repeat protein
MRGDIFKAIGNYEEAINNYKAANIRKTSDSNWNYLSMAQIYIEEGKLSEAADMLNNAIKECNCFTLAYVIKAKLAAIRGDWKTHEYCIQEAMRYNPLIVEGLKDEFDSPKFSEHLERLNKTISSSKHLTDTSKKFAFIDKNPNMSSSNGINLVTNDNYSKINSRESTNKYKNGGNSGRNGNNDNGGDGYDDDDKIIIQVLKLAKTNPMELYHKNFEDKLDSKMKQKFLDLVKKDELHQYFKQINGTNDKREITPCFSLDHFEKLGKDKAFRNKLTKEIWTYDFFHADHFEIYKNEQDYRKDKGDNHSRSVWWDGRPKEL